MQLVIFDLCDTLYDANTTVGFLEYYASRGNRRVSRALRRWTSRRSPWFVVGAAALRLLKRDIARNRLVASLAGEPMSSLQRAARCYAEDVLPAHANQPIHDRLAAHRAAGDRVVIVSSSLDLVVGPVAAMLGVEQRSSTLDHENGRCAGRIGHDLTGRKSAVAAELRKEMGGGELVVVTDNRSDKDLIDAADHAIIVLPHGRGTEPWGGSAHEHVRL